MGVTPFVNLRICKHLAQARIFFIDAKKESQTNGWLYWIDSHFRCDAGHKSGFVKPNKKITPKLKSDLRIFVSGAC